MGANYDRMPDGQVPLSGVFSALRACQFSDYAAASSGTRLIYSDVSVMAFIVASTSMEFEEK